MFQDCKSTNVNVCAAACVQRLLIKCQITNTQIMVTVIESNSRQTAVARFWSRRLMLKGVQNGGIQWAYKGTVSLYATTLNAIDRQQL